MPEIQSEISRAVTILKVALAEYRSCDYADCTDKLKTAQRRLEHAIQLLRLRDRPNWRNPHDKE